MRVGSVCLSYRTLSYHSAEMAPELGYIFGLLRAYGVLLALYMLWEEEKHIHQTDQG